MYKDIQRGMGGSVIVEAQCIPRCPRRFVIIQDCVTPQRYLISKELGLSLFFLSLIGWGGKR